ncbi:MAG: preprotein translocase subunit YajC [Calditrichaeota bacterium]|nr:MAG: preprotein translocase subunit YajC [Calditrichota bacterium]
MGQQGAPSGGGNFFVSFLPFLLIIAVFYFLIIRPQTKKQKEHQKLLQSLQKGDKVVTVGGIHGKIVGFKNDDKVLILKVDDNVKLEVERSAISSVNSREEKKN